MKLSNQMIENRLKRAVEATVPNVLPDLLLNIEKKEACKMNTNTRDEVTYKKKTHSGRWFKTLASVAAVAVLVFGVWFGLTNYSTEAVVAFDVNPSIELSVNRAEKVIRVNSRNSAAHEVVGDMDLKGVKLEVAVNALVGSMVQKGYISELNNSILITVNSNNAEKGEQLQDRLTASVSSLLTSLSVDGAIMTQTNSDSADELAQVYGISRGKAALIEKVVAEDSTLEYEDLVDLSINDLNLLIESRQPQMIQVRTSGQASDKGYIGTDRAKQIAFAHAGIAAADVRDLEVELDSNNGQMIYEVEFYANGFEYEYHIEAENGYIFEIGKDDDDDDDDKAQSTIRETSRATSQEGTKETERATERETVKSSERATSQETVKETERATERVQVTTAKQPSVYTKATSQETVKVSERATERATERVHTTTEQPAAPTTTTTTKPASSERLSAAGARAMVLNRFGGMIEKIEYNYNEYEPLYKGEAVKPGSRVVFELNAITHRFKKWDVSNNNDWDKWAHAVPQMITMDQAANSVISRSGQNYTFVQKIEFNWDDETPLYQGEAFYKGYKISFEIYAYGGGFYKWDLSGGDDTWAEKYYNVR